MELAYEILGMILFVIICLIVAVNVDIPKNIKRMKEEDTAYAKKKGLTLEELYAFRDKKRDRRIRSSIRNEVLIRDKYTCVYCGSNEDLAIDHIFPFSRGGSNEPENLQVLCKNCNSSKSNSIPKEFLNNT